MSQTLLANGLVIDGNGGPPIENGGVLVEGETIRWVGPMDEAPRLTGSDGRRTIDVGGRTIMPGMVEGHLHLSYRQVKELADLDLRCPVEESTIEATLHAKLVLECGYTAGMSAGALHRIDIAIRDAIRAGKIPGPRLLAAGRDISATASMLDWNPSYLKLGMDGLGIFADGVEECRKAARKVIKEGADIVKTFVTGEGMLFECQAEETTYSFEEVDVICREAHRRNRLVSAHVRSAEGVKIAVRAGVDILDHGTLMDAEAIDMVVAHKDRHFVVPTVGYPVAFVERAEKFGFSKDFVNRTKYESEVEASVPVMKALKKAGVRIVPGGDYGFVWCPHGEYARDLEHFVRIYGFTEMETLVAATRWGAEMMRMQDRIGTLEAGKLADLLVVDGNPLEDIRVLQDRSKLLLILQGGKPVVERDLPAPVRGRKKPAPAQA